MKKKIFASLESLKTGVDSGVESGSGDGSFSQRYGSAPKMSQISNTAFLSRPGAGEGWEEGGTPDGPEVVVDCAQVTGRPARQIVRPCNEGSNENTKFR
jgi:hypothetical protein